MEHVDKLILNYLLLAFFDVQSRLIVLELQLADFLDLGERQAELLHDGLERNVEGWVR